MSLFANGDFKIQESWERRANSRNSNRSGSARNRSGSRENGSLVGAGQRLLQPTPDILDSHVANHILREFQAEIPPPSSVRSEKKINSKEKQQKYPPRQKTNMQGDDDLVASMANRLKQVEATCNAQRNEIKEKNSQIEKLKSENTFLRGLRADSGKKLEEFQELEQKNKELTQKVQQMEEYLKKYGMKWVGNNPEGKLDKEKIKKAIANSKNNYRLPSEIDLGTIQRRVEELNGGLQSEGQGTEIYQENGVHKFRKAEALPIAFFGDGIAIKGFNFYPYKSKESLKILSDLVDGYFPYVLKGKYPNGVFLTVVDKIKMKYSEQEKSQDKIESLDDVLKNAFQPESKEQFLNKFPKNVIKNGKIIPIREGIEKVFEGKGAAIISLKDQGEESNDYEEIDGCYVLKTPTHQLCQEGILSPQEICTLKIRTESGKICIIELQKSDKIRAVYSFMRKIDHGQFKLMGNFPRRSYEESENENLEELGFFPNGNLHIQKLI